ncbi:hypothetical protein CHX27_11680 [Flavobacterium aurantiibacter]|uniref:Uncharacterized protein n=2 Tax=Flavobacterium aurantiibacter TaxID=2023067 RepID=A0A255ZMU8_9FLAO|nr:hypothetical protein CHX27_11680 [Flavobacterium aurantiibacter]
MLLLSSTFFCHAQELGLKTKLGPIFKDSRKNTRLSKVLEAANGEIIVVRAYYGGMLGRSAKGYFIECYNAQLELKREYDYNFEEVHKDSEDPTLDFLMDGNTLHIIELLYDKTSESYVFSANSGDLTTFKFQRKEILKLPYKKPKKGGLFSMSGSSGFGARLFLNDDKSAFLITIDIDQEKNMESHQFYLFDKSLNLKLEHTFERDIKERDYKVSQFEISNDGTTLYALGRFFTPESKSKEVGGKYGYELSRISAKGAVSNIFDSKDKYAASLKTVLIDDKLICVGFYSEKKDNRYKGICYYDIDPTTLKIKAEKFNPFSEQFMIDKYGKVKDKELRSLAFRGITTTENKEIIFNAEEDYSTSQTTFNANGGSRTITSYHKDDIICVKLNTAGNLEWSRNINKSEASFDFKDPYASYTSLTTSNNTYFFINSGEKVKKLSNDRIKFVQSSRGRANLNAIRINQHGDFDYQEIIDDKDGEIPFMVSNGYTTKNAIYFLGAEDKKKRLLKITLAE